MANLRQARIRQSPNWITILAKINGLYDYLPIDCFRRDTGLFFYWGRLLMSSKIFARTDDLHGYTIGYFLVRIL